MYSEPSLGGLDCIANMSLDGAVFPRPTPATFVLWWSLNHLNQTPVLTSRHVSRGERGVYLIIRGTL